MGNAQSSEVLLLEVGTLQSHFSGLRADDGETGSNASGLADCSR
jgi:hypothetical protein